MYSEPTEYKLGDGCEITGAEDYPETGQLFVTVNLPGERVYRALKDYTLVTYLIVEAGE